mmetsp:Transcript_1476/g.2807  ORF Transcript_1476/g.2807 Transcript_1476/m.2807 type:complete len:275 (+) Transcript_1476:403-1227(+)
MGRDRARRQDDAHTRPPASVRPLLAHSGTVMGCAGRHRGGHHTLLTHQPSGRRHRSRQYLLICWAVHLLQAAHGIEHLGWRGCGRASSPHGLGGRLGRGGAGAGRARIGWPALPLAVPALLRPGLGASRRLRQRAVPDGASQRPHWSAHCPPHHALLPVSHGLPSRGGLSWADVVHVRGRGHGGQPLLAVFGQEVQRRPHGQERQVGILLLAVVPARTAGRLRVPLAHVGGGGAAEPGVLGCSREGSAAGGLRPRGALQLSSLQQAEGAAGRRQ